MKHGRLHHIRFNKTSPPANDGAEKRGHVIEIEAEDTEEEVWVKDKVSIRMIQPDTYSVDHILPTVNAS